MAAPMKADSEIGVSSTRLGPYLRIQPLGDAEHAAPGVVLAGRAGAADDVLAEHDRRVGSRAISWSSASLIACCMVILRAMAAPPLSS